MAGSQRTSRRQSRDPGRRPTTASNGNAPTYTPVVWACDRCGATVSNQEGHNRFHAGLVALWQGRG
jgi:hypothetical protein